MPLPRDLPLHTVTLRVEQLREVGTRLLLAPELGVDTESAQAVTDELVKAEMAGYPSHGFSRFVRYVQYVLGGHINPKAGIEVIPTRKNGGAIVDGNFHFGQVIMRRVVEVALEGMKENAVFTVIVRRANHIGRLASYLEMAAEEGFIAKAEANVVGQPRVVPYGSIESRLGTEPHGAAVPCGDDPPLVYDASTASIVEGNCNILRMAGLPVPKGLLLDGCGIPTVDPMVLYLDDEKRGGILPLGLAELGYRGSGHAILINAVTGILAQTGFGKLQRVTGTNGVWFNLTDLREFVDYEDYVRDLKSYIDYLKSSKRADSSVPILLPGEGSRQRSAETEANGVRLPHIVWEETKNTANRVGVSLDDIVPISESTA